MDKYQWTCTGMATSDSANGPMRYIREIDYDALQAKVDRLTARGFEDLHFENEELRNKVEELTAAIKLAESDFGTHIMPALKEKADE